ncbi:hypothetical protein [Actinomycetospora sp. NBRC 106378]|uniref:hypothetical protein n=1 Tax=Actinomycetospora sp. NBRC 106378 TaxID=3032208 RepID=UPI0024A00EF7|nr:hypothetical protein [Actinomycetospora sp. NBRC 106378]GLZ54675.1 hypothetical protein Acsp07_42920 [Actinomycetospora sp. NBRC 106378]
MTYDAVSAYTVLLGDGVGPTTVSVHGSAVDAWAALAAAVGVAPTAVPRRRFGFRAGAAVVPPDGLAHEEVHDAAEAWRTVDPTRRFWQVTSHRLQVTVPAINTAPLVSRSA